MEQENVIAVTALGMVCSLGHDVDTACAAARAGIRRTDELEYPLRSPADGSVQSAIGHCVPLIASGFEGQVRLRMLLEAALTDLNRRIADDRWPDATPVYLALPDSTRVRDGKSLIADQNDREFQEGEDDEYSASFRPDWNKLIEQALQSAGWHVPAPVTQVFTSGHTGVSDALGQALADIAAGHSNAALVGGVDSLTGERTLAWLDRTERLRTPANPTGLFPGEAAAVFLIERQPPVPAHARARTLVRSVAASQEERPLFSGEQSVGAALFGAIDRLAIECPDNDPRSTWFITDLNGEGHRATEWGNALVRMGRKAATYTNPVCWYPAVSFGDVGAAMGAVCVCTAMKAWDRGYAPASRAIVTSASEGPRRTAALLEFRSSSQA